MDASDVLMDLYGRVPHLAREAIEDLDAEQLAAQPGKDANTIAWLIWHLARIQDAQVAELIGEPQLWEGGEWAVRLGLVPDPSNHGYGHSADEVRSIKPSGPDVLLDYLDTVDGKTQLYLRDLTPGDLERIVDRNWDPPVTLGVRLNSVVEDCLQHVGQAAYVRGLIGA